MAGAIFGVMIITRLRDTLTMLVLRNVIQQYLSACIISSAV